MLAEYEAKKLLLKYGIPTTKFELIENEEDIKNLALNYPVVLKVSSPKILHKTDVGGVVLNIGNREELLKEYKKLRKKFPEEKFIVEEMEKQGVEIIAGIVNDAAFGKCVMVGMGGIFTEIYKDVAFRMLPITEKDAEDMLNDLKARGIFYGYRLNLDRKALIDILLKITKIAEETPIKQLDLNPIFLYEKGAKVIDAKIIMEE
ncbi:MAG: acetyl-CoA synthetase [Thermoplasmata archaeon]|nr:MAG: acetyl-CoA synthetase [Thermoplasmata archaeon]HDN95773.1 acetyl-CoA synthetase [Thermoplasmatales archaeon]